MNLFESHLDCLLRNQDIEIKNKLDQISEQDIAELSDQDLAEKVCCLTADYSIQKHVELQSSKDNPFVEMRTLVDRNGKPLVSRMTGKPHEEAYVKYPFNVKGDIELLRYYPDDINLQGILLEKGSDGIIYIVIPTRYYNNNLPEELIESVKREVREKFSKLSDCCRVINEIIGNYNSTIPTKIEKYIKNRRDIIKSHTDRSQLRAFD